MSESTPETRPPDAWTLRKAVTALAIAPQNEGLTRVGRMAFNVMIYISQQSAPDAQGWWSAPISHIVKGFGATTRDSPRVIEYIERMARTTVRWYPLSPSDVVAADRPGVAVLVPGEQTSLEGIDPPRSNPHDALDGTRVFTLLSEARFFRRAGEAWVQWYFAPSIREMLIEPVRWAQIDLQELAALSRYASVALYEICSRYKNVPGGLTNRASPEWWVNALRSDVKETTREWRKFKNESLKPALAEINQRTSLEIKVVEYKQGRAVTEVQFLVRKKQLAEAPEPPDLGVIDQAGQLGIKERELDALIDAHGEANVRLALEALAARMKVQLKERVANPVAYLKGILRNDLSTGSLFGAPQEPPSRRLSQVIDELSVDPGAEWLQQRMKQLNDEIDQLSIEELESHVERAKELMHRSGTMTPALQKRLETRQYGSPLIRQYIRMAYAEQRYGSDWKTAPTAEHGEAP